MVRKFKLKGLQGCLLFGATLATVGCELINPSVVQETRFGLWDAQVVSDSCNIGDQVTNYFTSGTVNNIPDPNETARERALGQMAYNSNEEGYYKLKYRNQYRHLLEYVAENHQGDLATNCTSSFSIEMSIGYPEQSFEEYVRVGSDQTYLFISTEENELCLVKSYPWSNLPQPSAIVRSCTDLTSNENIFSVQFQ